MHTIRPPEVLAVKEVEKPVCRDNEVSDKNPCDSSNLRGLQVPGFHNSCTLLDPDTAGDATGFRYHQTEKTHPGFSAGWRG